MNSKYEQILSAEIPPLIPYELLDEYNDFMNPLLREVLRSNCLRRYLEGAIDLLLKGKIISASDIDDEKWNHYNLNNKIQAIGKYYDKDIEVEFDELRKIGNEGSHFGNDVSKVDINKGISIATKIIEMVLIHYFKDYPLGSQLPVMTLLSSLPPKSRIFILRSLWEYGQQNMDVIDKLSMAYLKSGQYQKSLLFLKEIKDQGILSDIQFDQFALKINMLNNNLDKFDISKNILDVKRIFETLTNSNDYSTYSEFVNIILVLISGYKEVQ